MIKLENTKVVGWEDAIRGMRNPKNSWDRIDSYEKDYVDCEEDWELKIAEMCGDKCFVVGPNDHRLAMTLAKGGPVHAKYRRFIMVYVDITAPLYWWKEADTYRIGVEKDSCSTMHKIHDKEFTLEDFSCEHLKPAYQDKLETVISALNGARYCYTNWDKEDSAVHNYFENDKKNAWWQMIQLLPSSYNQKRTVMLSYEALANIYEYRRFHKLDEWREMCKWIETLPYSEIITKPILEQSKKVDVDDIRKIIEDMKANNPYQGDFDTQHDEFEYCFALDTLLKRLEEK